MSLSGHSWCFYFSCPGVASMFPGVRMYVFCGMAFVVVPVLGRQPRRLARVSLPCVLRPAFHSPPSHRRAPASPLPRRRAVNADKRYPRTRSLPHFCSSRNSVNIRFTQFYYAKPYGMVGAAKIQKILSNAWKKKLNRKVGNRLFYEGLLLNVGDSAQCCRVSRNGVPRTG